MTGDEIAAVSFLAVITVGGWALVPRYWNGRNNAQATTLYRSWIFLTRPAQRGLYRASLALTVGWTMVAAGLLTVITAEELVGDEVDVAATGFFRFGLIATIGGLCTFLVLVPMIMLFNRPRILVAPRLRGQPGLATLWRRALRIRRAERRQKRQKRKGRRPSEKQSRLAQL